jgi:hypothetical protein
LTFEKRKNTKIAGRSSFYRAFLGSPISILGRHEKTKTTKTPLRLKKEKKCGADE